VAVADAPAKPAAAATGDAGAAAAAQALLKKNACIACHAIDGKLVGPAFRDVARKYGDRADAATYLAGKIRSGGTGVWGAIPMPPQTLPDAEAAQIAAWLAAGAKK
jgi:cytochrome c